MEISTRKVIISDSVGLAQAHLLTKTMAMRKQPSAGLGPVTVHPTHWGVGPRVNIPEEIFLLKKMERKKCTSAVRSTKNHFDQNSALQAACDTSTARVTGGVYLREGCRSVTPPLLPGSRGLRRSALFCARQLYNPH